MVKLIEMVCSGNSGRSPVAELLAKKRVKEQRADEEYDSISSGVYVDLIRQGDYTIPLMVPFIELAKQREDVFTPEEISQVDKAIRNGDTETVKRYFVSVIKRFFIEEYTNRTRALEELGIQGDIKTGKDQTIVRPDTLAVLSMGDRENGRVRQIYDGSAYNPKIEILSVFATGNPKARLDNSFGRGYVVYKEMIEQMIKQVPVAVDKLIRA